MSSSFTLSAFQTLRTLRALRRRVRTATLPGASSTATTFPAIGISGYSPLSADNPALDFVISSLPAGLTAREARRRLRTLFPGASLTLGGRKASGRSTSHFLHPTTTPLRSALRGSTLRRRVPLYSPRADSSISQTAASAVLPLLQRFQLSRPVADADAVAIRFSSVVPLPIRVALLPFSSLATSAQKRVAPRESSSAIPTRFAYRPTTTAPLTADFCHALPTNATALSASYISVATIGQQLATTTVAPLLGLTSVFAPLASCPSLPSQIRLATLSIRIEQQKRQA